jgi:hypothetical protein
MATIGRLHHERLTERVFLAETRIAEEGFLSPG